MNMRVAYVCADPGVPVFGSKGASVHVQEVVRSLLRHRADVELFAARAGGICPPDLVEIRMHSLPLSTARDISQREQDAHAVNDRLRALLRANGPFDLVYERYALWSFAAMEYAHDARIPGLLEVNAPLIEEQIAHRSLVDRVTAERSSARAFAAASNVIAVSNQVAAYAARYTDPQHIRVVPNGVDVVRCSPDVAPSLPADDGVLTLGFVGTMKPWHGLDVLANAFECVHAAFPQSRLLMVGDGPERERIRQGLDEKGLSPAVVFTGSVAAHEVPGLLTSMNVAAAPYPARDDFYFSPLKIFEYMAAGLPVVASSIGQIPDVLDDGVTGALVPAGNPDALATKVIELFNNAAKRRRIGAAARECVRSTHTWDRVVSRILQIADEPGQMAGAVARQ